MDAIVFNIIIQREIEKSAAFGVREALIKARQFKARQAPRNVYDDYSAYHPGELQDIKDRWGILGPLISRMEENSMKGTGIAYGQVAAPSKGDALRLHRSIDKKWGDDIVGADRNWSPEDRIVLEGINKGHELGELRSPYTRALDLAGHNTGAIIDEHNMTRAARGSGFWRPADLMSRLRRGEGSESVIQLVDPGFSHSVSPRYSRHAKKRIIETLERKSRRGEIPGYDLPWYQRILGGK